jgi:hypothetical protein
MFKKEHRKSWRFVACPRRDRFIIRVCRHWWCGDSKEIFPVEELKAEMAKPLSKILDVEADYLNFVYLFNQFSTPNTFA